MLCRYLRATVNATRNDGATAFMLAAGGGHTAAMEMLVSYGATVKASDKAERLDHLPPNISEHANGERRRPGPNRRCLKTHLVAIFAPTLGVRSQPSALRKKNE